MRGILSVRHPNLPFLNGGLQLHAGFRECGQGAAPIQGQIYHGQIIQPIECNQVFLPPLVGATSSIGIDVDMFCAPAGSANGFLIWLAHLNPEVDGPCQILAPESRLFFGAEPTAKGQGLMSVQVADATHVTKGFVRA